jgi:Flp pilus assembly CpaE family ATPase
MQVWDVAVVDRTGVVEDLVVAAAETLGLAFAVRTAHEVRPDEREDVLVIGPRECTRAGLRRVSRWTQVHPTAVVAAVGVPVDGPGADALRASGVRVISRGTPTPAKLRTAIRTVDERLAQLRADTVEFLRDEEPEALVAPAPVVTDVVADPSAELSVVSSIETSPEVAAFTGSATVITVASATGGCGKTFYATNPAAMVAQSGKRTLLIDLDLQFGEVAPALRLRHPYTIYDGLYDGNGQPLDTLAMDEHLSELVAHSHLGFDVLIAPRDPAHADHVGARDAARTLDVAGRHYDVIIVDTPPSLNEVVLTALDRSDSVAVLATLDVPSLKNLTVFLDTLKRLRLDDSHVRLLLNKVEADIGITVAQAQETFDGRFVGAIPTSRAVSRSINAGTVVIASEPRATVSVELRKSLIPVLPGGLVPVSPDAPARRNLFARLASVLRPAGALTGGTP